MNIYIYSEKVFPFHRENLPLHARDRTGYGPVPAGFYDPAAHGYGAMALPAGGAVPPGYAVYPYPPPGAPLYPAGPPGAAASYGGAVMMQVCGCGCVSVCGCVYVCVCVRARACVGVTVCVVGELRRGGGDTGAAGFELCFEGRA
jgi:hypothetical protein